MSEEFNPKDLCLHVKTQEIPPCPFFYYVDWNSDFINTYNLMVNMVWRMGIMDEKEIQHKVSDLLMDSENYRNSYLNFLRKLVSKKISKTPFPSTPLTPDFPKMPKLNYSYGMWTFTSPTGHFGTDDEKALQYFTPIYEKYLKPGTKFRNANNIKTNAWLEVVQKIDGLYYHMHVFYRCEIGQWIYVNKGTLKKNEIIKYNINGQAYKINKMSDIDHLNACVVYNYDDKNSRVVQNYINEFQIIE